VTLYYFNISHITTALILKTPYCSMSLNTMLLRKQCWA